jgi:hypothetical protein
MKAQSVPSSPLQTIQAMVSPKLGAIASNPTQGLSGKSDLAMSCLKEYLSRDNKYLVPSAPSSRKVSIHQTGFEVEPYGRLFSSGASPTVPLAVSPHLMAGTRSADDDLFEMHE